MVSRSLYGIHGLRCSVMETIADSTVCRMQTYCPRYIVDYNGLIAKCRLGKTARSRRGCAELCLSSRRTQKTSPARYVRLQIEGEEHLWIFFMMRHSGDIRPVWPALGCSRLRKVSMADVSRSQHPARERYLKAALRQGRDQTSVRQTHEPG